MKNTWLVLFGLFGSISQLGAQTRFLPLGYLDGSGPTSEAYAVTPDGSKIVGYSTTSVTQNVACLWSSSNLWQSGTIAALPASQEFYNNSAQSTSSDGGVIVGLTGYGGSTSAEQAFFYTPATHIQPVPFPSPQMTSDAAAVTTNGAIVVGVAESYDTSQSKAFRWDRTQAAAVFLPPYPLSNVPNAAAEGVSGDGRRVIGVVQTSLKTYAAARWDDGGAPVLFSKAGDAVVAVQAQSITPDGTVVVGGGYIASTGQGVGFRWTAAGGVVALPIPTTGGTYAIEAATAEKISGDGYVIVGYGHNVHGEDEAIVWIDLQPYRVATIANAAGVLPPSWETFRAYGTNYNGNVICGMGRATSGKLEAYVLVLDASRPTPSPTPTATPKSTPTPTPTATPKSSPMATPTPTATPQATSTSTPSTSPTATPTATPSATPTAGAASNLANISTRLKVQTGDNALIGGFIVTGTEPKRVIVRAIGPSLSVTGKLADPILELRDGSGQLLEANDNWVDSPNKQAIIDSTIPPPNNLESAIVRTLPANNSGYTAIVRGVNNTTGIGVVEAYDLNRTVDSKLANISTRGLVQTGDNVLIAGTIILGEVPKKVIIRAIGPSLSVPGKLSDPVLELRDSNGALLEVNDNWRDSPNKQAIIDSTIPPADPLESAIVRTLPAGGASYTAVVRGANGATGIGVVEIYGLQ